MDLPVALGIVVSFLASLYGTWSGGGTTPSMTISAVAEIGSPWIGDGTISSGRPRSQPPKL